MDKYEEMYETLKSKVELAPYSNEYKIKYMERSGGTKIIPTAYADEPDYVYLNWDGTTFLVLGVYCSRDPLYAKLLNLPTDDVVKIIAVQSNNQDVYCSFYYPLSEDEKNKFLPMFFDLLFIERSLSSAQNQQVVDRQIGLIVSNMFLKNIDSNKLVLDESDVWVPHLGPEFYHNMKELTDGER